MANGVRLGDVSTYEENFVKTGDEMRISIRIALTQ